MSGESLDDITLPDLSWMGDPETLREQAEAMLRAGRADLGPATEYEGADESGSVKVVVDPKGRVVDVIVLPVWTDELGADRLAGGVYGAYVAAVQKAMAIERATRTDRRASDEQDTGWPAVPEPGEADFDTWLAAVAATNAEARARLARLAQPEPPRPEEEFRSPGGLLTLRVRGGDLVSVEGNADGLRWTDVNALRHDALAVFRAAGLAEPRHGARDDDEDDESNEDLGVLDF